MSDNLDVASDPTVRRATGAEESVHPAGGPPFAIRSDSNDEHWIEQRPAAVFFSTPRRAGFYDQSGVVGRSA